MRFRRLAAPLSVVALAALALVGCASGGDAGATPSASPTASAAANLCDAAAKPGKVSEAVTVSGPENAAPTITVPAGSEVTGVERTVAVEGTGEKPKLGDYVTYALSAYDVTTGKLLQSQGYGDSPLPPQELAIGSGADSFFGCAPVGSRIVMAMPASQNGNAQIIVADILGLTPAAKWCQPVDGAGPLPEVSIASSGEPTITVPANTPAPTDLALKVLTEGDGEVVKPGDNVTVDYTGVAWSTGKVFDSSWSRGEPASFQTTGVVTGFKRALEGQKVGSTVEVVMPPRCGYGEGTIDPTGASLTGETLVFVVTIKKTAAAQ